MFQDQEPSGQGEARNEDPGTPENKMKRKLSVILQLSPNPLPTVKRTRIDVKKSDNKRDEFEQSEKAENHEIEREIMLRQLEKDKEKEESRLKEQEQFEEEMREES